jgi:hypothetical protein
MKRDVSVSYWQIKHIRNALERDFKSVNSEETFWNYQRNILGPQLFSDSSLPDIIKYAQHFLNSIKDE